MNPVPVRREKFEYKGTETDTQKGKESCEDGSRKCKLPQTKGMSRTSGSHQRPEEAWSSNILISDCNLSDL
jgi:hypothetical protein